MSSFYYLIARYGRRAELQGYKAILEQHGHAVTNRDDVPRTMLNLREYERQLAENCIADLQAADRVLLFTDWEDQGYDGCQWVMAGFALWTLIAAPGRIHVHLIGPDENIFCALAPHKWESFDAYLAWQQAQDAQEEG